MNLSIRNLLPAYFAEERKIQSELWGKEISILMNEYVKIVAPSGSGKTSLIHFLYGTRNDYTGEIFYDENKLRDFNPETKSVLRKDKLSIVFQDLRLFPELTVMENLEIKRSLNPYHEKPMITQMAVRLGIESKLNSTAKTCSYGEQQRVSIIRALLQPFDLLLLDEPFSHLDNANAEKSMELMMEETKKRNASILFADLERIEFFPYTRIYHL